MPATMVGTPMMAAQPASFFMASFWATAGEVGLEGAREELAQRVHVVVDPNGVVVDVAEVRPSVLGDERLVEAHEPVAHVHERGDGALDREHVALEVVD